MKKLYTEDNTLIEYDDQFIDIARKMRENTETEAELAIWQSLRKQYSDQYDTDFYNVEFAVWDYIDNCNALVE